MAKQVRDFNRANRDAWIERLTDSHLTSLLNVKGSDIRGRGVLFGRIATCREEGLPYSRKEEVVRLDTDAIASRVAASIRNVARNLLGSREVEK
jgi:hypothetical protein